MAKIDATYNYLLTTYGKTTGSRYDSHKKSELRSVYNSIVKANKESPLYKLDDSVDVTKFAIDIKEGARHIQNVIASLNESGDDISSVLNKKIALSSNEDAVSVTYVGNGSSDESSAFDLEIVQLATPQINEGQPLNPKAHSFQEGSFSFDLDTPSNSYEFQFNVNSGDNNYDVQSKIARLVNRSDIGLIAEVVTNDANQTILRISSKQTGLAEGEDSLFSIHSGTSWNELNTLGIGQIVSPAKNSAFILNGKEHTSLANTFTINKTFEVSLHQPTEKGSPAHIGFKANIDAISDSINDMLEAYNGMVAISHKYSGAQHNGRLLSEMTSIGRGLQEELSAAGITSDEQSMLHLDRGKLSDAINSDDSDKHFKTLTTFKNALFREAQKTSINPMNYVDKVIVEYKNPGKSFAAPYAPSSYIGLLVDHHL